MVKKIVCIALMALHVSAVHGGCMAFLKSLFCKKSSKTTRAAYAEMMKRRVQTMEAKSVASNVSETPVESK